MKKHRVSSNAVMVGYSLWSIECGAALLMILLPKADRDQRGGGGGYLRNHRVENFDDQRGGGGYRGGRDDHEPRPKNPIPDHPPFKVRSLMELIPLASR